MLWRATTILTCLALAAPALAQTTFSVSLDPAVAPGDGAPVAGRLVVYLIREGSSLPASTRPGDGPFFDDPQPMYGIDAANFTAAAPIVINDLATSFPTVLSRLEAGKYKAQAVLDTQRLDSSWRREPGNLYSEVVAFEVPPAAAPESVKLTLTKKTEARGEEPVTHEGKTIAETFTMRSELLSAFRGRDVYLRAGVVFPKDHDPARQYAAIYEAPGFGGNHRSSGRLARQRTQVDAAATHLYTLATSTFAITLDPEGPNGHTLFADSANNGPCGRALVEELIPALDKKYNLVSKPEARLLRGHSSGGWSVLWLAITYPEVFGACWSSSPDPVDFQRMQKPDIYAARNFYYALGPEDFPTPPLTNDMPETPSYRNVRGEARMSNRQENLMEEVLGPDNTSAQQWDSWFAAWGPRNTSGNPAALFDATTGVIDHSIAEQYRAYDIADLVRKAPGVLGPIFKQRMRLVVGDMDNYYLNEAVERLKAEVDKLSFAVLREGSHGHITILPGLDHGTIFRAKELAEFPRDMAEHLRRHKLSRD